MQAVISGQAGVALVLDEDGFSSIHAGKVDEMIRRRDREIPYLLGNAGDFQVFEDVDLLEVAHELEIARTKAEALHIALILLDPQMPHDTRREAAEDLTELLATEDVQAYVEAVLYSRPVPVDGDLPGALLCCTGRCERARQLLVRLSSLQGEIAAAFEAWERIPDRIFGSAEDRQHVLSSVVREGLFRDLVQVLASHAPFDAFRRKALLNPAFTAARNRREILREWLSPLREPDRLTGSLRHAALQDELGVSPSWQNVLHQVGRVAPSAATVLITGESGTGKEVVARLLHEGSPRAGKPLVMVNCAALPEQLLESELFGHEEWAFTGVCERKAGLLELAAGGTLFLDEIAELGPAMQANLLRVLADGKFQRLGGTRTLPADVRVIAATHRDLAQAVACKDFREDLYYRLNVFGIHLPPLRERHEDVLLLAQIFLEDLEGTVNRPASGIAPDAREWLLAHPWPGNVRELKNAIQRATLLCNGGLITREHLSASVALRGMSYSTPANTRYDAASAAMERNLVESALRETRGNRTQAARLLDLTRAQLYSRIDKYGLDH